MWLFAIFAGIPLMEIALFILVGGAIGLWSTLGTVIFTAAVGTWLVRTQGSSVLRQLRESFSGLHDPTEPLAHGAMILVSGLLLLTPGFFTDGRGFALLVSPVRSTVFRYLRQRFRAEPRYGANGPGRRFTDPRADVVEAEFRDVPPPDGRPAGSGWSRH